MVAGLLSAELCTFTLCVMLGPPDLGHMVDLDVKVSRWTYGTHDTLIFFFFTGAVFIAGS